MRPTKLTHHLKEKTGEFVLPLCTNDGKSLSTCSQWYPKSKTTFPKGQRWGYLDEAINRTGFRVGPGAYPFKISTNRGISAVIKKDYFQQDPALRDPFIRNSVHSIKSEKSLVRSQSALSKRKRNTVAAICPTMSTLTMTQSTLGADKSRRSLGNNNPREGVMARSSSVAKTKPYDLLDYLSFQELAGGVTERESSSNYMRTEPHEKVILTERMNTQYMNSCEDQPKSAERMIVSRKTKLIQKQSRTSRVEANWDLRGDFAHLKSIVLARPQVQIQPNIIIRNQL